MPRRPFAAALCALLLSPEAPAADPKPTPTPSSASGLPIHANAAAPLQKPDLVVTFEGPGPGLPTGFTVKNIGNADAKASILKVTATLVPPDAASAAAGLATCPSYMTPEQCEAMLGFAGLGLGLGGVSVVNVTKACGNPFPEFLEAVPPLKPGESKTFTRNTGPSHVTLSLSPQAVSPQATHVKKCPSTLVCAWDVKAVADAVNDNDEANEHNNTATRFAQREVSFK